MATDTIPKLHTAEEFADLANERDGLCELVRGEVLEMTRPTARHGVVCANVSGSIWIWARQERKGRVVSNDAGVVTQRDPDSVRGPDLYFISESRLPGGQLPTVWLEVPPEICVEVLSQNDRWKDVLEKITEYLDFGVLEVWVADPELKQLHVYGADAAPQLLLGEDTLQSPILPGYESRVSDFFEGC